MRSALEFAAVAVVGSPLVGMLAGHLWARAHGHNLHGTSRQQNINLVRHHRQRVLSKKNVP